MAAFSTCTYLQMSGEMLFEAACRAWAGRDRLEAAHCALQIRPMQKLDQGPQSEVVGLHADHGRDVLRQIQARRGPLCVSRRHATFSTGREAHDRTADRRICVGPFPTIGLARYQLAPTANDKPDTAAAHHASTLMRANP